MKRSARISSGKLPVASACPNCMKKLDGVTGVSWDGDFKRVGPTRKVSIEGSMTMCAYCGVLLMFADEDGRLRLMTAEERAAKVDPAVQQLIDDFRRDKVKPPDFTKRSFN